MTKRYNMFNYAETYVGIFFLLVLPVFFAFILYLVFHNSPDASPLFMIASSLFVLLIIAFSFIPNGIKFIRKGRAKAYQCADGFIYGRVRADEATSRYINHLDFIKALEYCNGKGCYHCPFHISCRRTQSEWMIQNARRYFNNLDTSDELTRITTIIDRYNNCDHKTSCVDCQHYENDCLETQLDNLQRDIFTFFRQKGYTSAEQLRERSQVI